ncbi:uncharacterized protein J7T54_000963 [Emericellopsis cladophorae]|uniref:Rhodopsin domain-containing protein n=1 Tax=Emericellopsis cladophorae TaxID=2686198 RepID=A0A9P9Y484_9HYPO|nr:uncharacterized protein J7T54_000963 [Emericellopsis cladophorae]KAI6782820.1 hypothetical protein J7T54_000963 [Emericellopsis cladophorae]
MEEICMFIALGALGGTAYAGYEMVETPGYYVHQWNLVNGDLVRPLYLILVYGCCYSVVLPLIKTAILLDWCRVFVPTDKYRNPFWWGCVTLSTFQCVWGVMCIILLNMQCRPHNAIWEFYVPSKCYGLPSVMLGSASVQVITDICMVLLPQREIWRLHMNWQRKAGIALMFGVGMIACIAACFRLSHTITFSKELDRMYFIGPLLFWAWAEMTAGFFIFSFPCLPRILAESPLPQTVKSLFGISAGSRPSASGNSNPIVTIGGSGAKAKTKGGHVEIPDDGMPMDDQSPNDSQEALYRGKAPEEEQQKENGEVRRTVQVSVTSDARSNSPVPDNGMPWSTVGRRY